MIPGVDTDFCRTPEIISDSAHIILNRPGKDSRGNFFLDDEVLASEGVLDLDKYAVVPGTKEFIKDLYVD
jgi:citronellol/citronellal dehydrogenase